MIEALQTLATITDYTDEQLDDLIREFGSDCLLHGIGIPVAAVIQARTEYKLVPDKLAANIIACAESFADVIDIPSLQGVCDIPGATEKFLALRRAIKNLRRREGK